MNLKKMTLPRFGWIGLFAVIVVPSIASYCSRTHIIGSDGLAYYAPLRSLIIDGDLDFTNEFRDYNPNHHVVPDYSVKTKTGHVGNKYGIGVALLWMPFFLAAHGLVHLLTLLGMRILADGYSLPYQIAVGIGSMVYGLIGLWLIYKLCRIFYSPRMALWSVACVALCTNVYYYFIVEPSMSHLVSLCSISLFAYLTAACHQRHSWRSAVVIGLSIGLMAIVRFQNICFGFLLLYELIDRPNRQPLSNLLRLLPALAAGMAIAMLPQAVFWKILYGSYFVYSYGSEGFNFLQPHLLKTLLSVHHGLITWTPLIGFCLFGLGLSLTGKHRNWGALMALVFLIQWYVGSSWHCWWFAASFGQRTMADISVVFAFGLASLLEKLWSKQALRPVFLTCAGLLATWNFFIILVVTKRIVSYPNILSRIFTID